MLDMLMEVINVTLIVVLLGLLGTLSVAFIILSITLFIRLLK